MDLDPDYTRRSDSVNIELREMVADVVHVNFRELEQLRRAVESHRPGKPVRIKWAGDEIHGARMAIQSLEDGIRWFSVGGNYWIWIGAMRYESEEPGLIAARYIESARELQARLRAILDGAIA